MAEASDDELEATRIGGRFGDHHGRDATDREWYGHTDVVAEIMTRAEGRA